MKILVNTLTDEKFLPGTEVVLASFINNITNPEGHEITYSYTSPKRLESKILDKYGVIWIPYTGDYEHLAFMNEWHPGTKISLERLRFFDKKDFDRIITVDSDMLISDNVDYLLSEALNSKCFWAVHDYACQHYYATQIEKLGLPPSKMINGGLQVINNGVHTFAMQFQVGQSFDGSDQGYLSQYFYEEDIDIGFLPIEYNYAFMDAYYPQCETPRVIHFTGPKPWMTDVVHPYFIQWRIIYEHEKHRESN